LGGREGGDGRHVAGHAHVDRAVAAQRGRVEVDLGDRRAGADELAVSGGPHVQRATPGDDEVGLGDERRGQRGGEPAGDVEVPRVAGEEALRGGGHGQQRAPAVGERDERLAGARAPRRAPPRDEDRPPRGLERPYERLDVNRVTLYLVFR